MFKLTSSPFQSFVSPFTSNVYIVCTQVIGAACTYPEALSTYPTTNWNTTSTASKSLPSNIPFAPIFVNNPLNSNDASPLRKYTSTTGDPLSFWNAESSTLHRWRTALLTPIRGWDFALPFQNFANTLSDDKYKTTHSFIIFKILRCKVRNGSNVNEEYVSGSPPPAVSPSVSKNYRHKDSDTSLSTSVPWLLNAFSFHPFPFVLSNSSASERTSILISARCQLFEVDIASFISSERDFLSSCPSQTAFSLLYHVSHMTYLSHHECHHSTMWELESKCTFHLLFSTLQNSYFHTHPISSASLPLLCEGASFFISTWSVD